jgi:hypothetical protein
MIIHLMDQAAKVLLSLRVRGNFPIRSVSYNVKQAIGQSSTGSESPDQSDN